MPRQVGKQPASLMLSACSHAFIRVASPAAVPRGKRIHLNDLVFGAAVLKTFHYSVDIGTLKPPSHQERDQPPLPHRRRQARELPRSFFRQLPHRLPRINALGRERSPYGILRHTSVDTLCLQIAHKPRRATPPPCLGRRVIGGEAFIVEEASRRQACERAVNRRRWVLLLQQAAPQVEARVRPPRQGPQRGAMRSLEIGKLLQTLEYQRPDLRANDQLQACEIRSRERCKTPPIHFDQPIVGPSWIGGESSQDHSSVAAVSSSPPPPAPAGAFTPRCSFTRASTSADMSGWSLR